MLFNERLDLFPLLNKILSALSFPKCIEGLSSMNYSQRLLTFDISHLLALVLLFHQYDILIPTFTEKLNLDVKIKSQTRMH